MAGKSVSIYDIAQIAGVSAATVSKVLNGKGSISAKTRERVLAIAREQGYVASFAARALREGNTRTVGIVVPDISNSFYSSIVLGVETLLYDAGYTCYICDTHNDNMRMARNLESLVHRQVEGLVLVNGRQPQAALLPDDLPLVGIDCAYATQAPWRVDVRTDYTLMVTDAVHILASRGCRHIGLVVILSNTGREDSEDPLELVFRDALARENLSLERKLVLRGPHLRESRIEAEELVGMRLDEGSELDGIVCIGDRAALGACAAIDSRGRRIGHDIKVIGTDDTLYARIARPAISSINRHIDEMAAEGVAALLAMMAGDQPSRTNLIIPHEVVERDSTLG